MNFAHLTFVLSSSLLVRFSVPKTKQKSKIGEKRTESIEKKRRKNDPNNFSKRVFVQLTHIHQRFAKSFIIIDRANDGAYV